jgi:hypothetical protein
MDIAERVVFGVSALGLARVYEDTDGHRQLTSVDQVVEETTDARISPSGSRYMRPSWKTMSDAGSDSVYCAGTYTE